jgi:hypothetical protein
MSSIKPEAGEDPKPPEIIRPGPDAQPPENVRPPKERPPTPTDRLEARADRHIEELRKDKQRLQDEIAHLRADLRWLDGLASWQRQALARLQTSYDNVIAFNWLSFALVVIGGGGVSYAALLPTQLGAQMVATGGFAALVIGVVVQGWNSRRGSTVVLKDSAPPSDDSRPRPYPQSHATAAPP